jgi:sugar-specific transcriptional regulator TrmB
MNLFRKLKSQNTESKTQEIQPQHILVAGAGLEILRDLKEKVDQLQLKLTEIEKKLEERIPEKVLTESKFKEEVQTSEDIVERIVSEVRELAKQKSVIRVLEERLTEEKPTIVEFKRIEKITELLQKHGKLSSSQLAQLMNLSRTRSNEYLKQMENLGIVEPIIIGREKFYMLKS